MRWFIALSAATAVLCGLGSISTAFSSPVELGEVQSVIYRGRPIHVEVPIGAERLIEFNGMAMKVFVPDELINDVAIESWPGSVFLTSKVAFKSKRFRFGDIASGKVFILDITAVDGAPTVPLKILTPAEVEEHSESVSAAAHSEREIESVSVVGLTRYAFQQLYSPDRLVGAVAGVYSHHLEKEAPIRTLVPGYNTLAKPVASWRTTHGLYATAIYLENYESRVLELDPRALRAGEGWVSSAFWNGVLTPVGSSGSTTSLVVITDRPWSGSATWLR